MPTMVRLRTDRPPWPGRPMGDERVETVDEDLARWAVGPGLEVIAAAAERLRGGEDVLALASWLRRDLDHRHAAFTSAAASTRLRAEETGVPGADRLVLTREALEQASHPAAAAWRAARAAASLGGDPVVQDRCAGTGGDAVAFALHGPVLAVERDPGRAVLARHRAAVLHRPVEVRVGDALDPLLPTAGTVVHADPDRRDATGRRARRLADHGPDVAALLAATEHAAGRLVTVAPGVAWDDPDLPGDAEVVFLQHGRALLEAVLCTGTARHDGARARAVLLDGDHELVRLPGRREAAPVGPVGSHLLRPAPALVRARLHDELALRVGARRLATNRALLTADHAPAPSPWVDVERVLAVVAPRPAAVRDVLPPDRAVEVVLHGVEADVRRWQRSLRRPTGPDDVRVHLVRRDDDAVAVVTRPDDTVQPQGAHERQRSHGR